MFFKSGKRYIEWNLERDGKIFDLSSLDESERKVFILFEVVGMQQRDIAGALGVTTVTVGQYLDRARQELGLKWKASRLED